MVLVHESFKQLNAPERFFSKRMLAKSVARTPNVCVAAPQRACLIMGGTSLFFHIFFKKAILMKGGQMMYLFDDLGSQLRNLTPPCTWGQYCINCSRGESAVIFCEVSPSFHT